MDSQTDKKIQTTVRTAFKDCTVLTIAHRLETIADYDRIVVMDAGRVAEFGVPFNLLQNKDGIFSSLVNALGPEVRAAFVATMRQRTESLGAGHELQGELSKTTDALNVGSTNTNIEHLEISQSP